MRIFESTNYHMTLPVLSGFAHFHQRARASQGKQNTSPGQARPPESYSHPISPPLSVPAKHPKIDFRIVSRVMTALLIVVRVVESLLCCLEAHVHILEVCAKELQSRIQALVFSDHDFMVQCRSGNLSSSNVRQRDAAKDLAFWRRAGIKISLPTPLHINRPIFVSLH